MLGPFGDGLGGFKMVFLVILGLLKFVKNSTTLSLGECRDARNLSFEFWNNSSEF